MSCIKIEMLLLFCSELLFITKSGGTDKKRLFHQNSLSAEKQRLVQ